MNDSLGSFPIETAVDRIGDEVRIILTVDLPESTHIEPHEPTDPFLIPTVVTVNGLDDPAVEYPVPVEKDLGWHDTVLTVLAGRLQFAITGRVRTAIDQVTGGLTYQPCVGGACLPPRTTMWSVSSKTATTVAA
jgi:hypothetical protein